MIVIAMLSNIVGVVVMSVVSVVILINRVLVASHHSVVVSETLTLEALVLIVSLRISIRVVSSGILAILRVRIRMVFFVFVVMLLL